MDFTSNIILSLLRPYRGRPYIQAEGKKTYRWVSTLPDLPEELETDMLYVCRLSEAMALNQSASCHFVCICDRYLSDEERENNTLMQNLIVVEENRSLSWLLNLIQNRFLELENWEKELKDVLLRDGTYQDLMDVSEHYLKNALFVMDGAYRLIAYSKNYKSPDPVNVALYEKGYHGAEIMQRFYRYNRFEEYVKNPGVILCTPGQVSRFESMCKWCWYDGTPLVQGVEVFYNTPVSAESAELFDLLMHYINICFLKEQKKNQDSEHTYGRFLRDMIYQDLTNIDQITACAKRTNVPLAGNFNAYRIVFRDNGKVLMGRFCQELTPLISSSRIISKDFEVTVLNEYSTPHMEELSKRNLQQIRPLLEKHGAMVGVSAPFFALTDFRHACAQAAVALRYGGRGSHPGCRRETQDDMVYSFDQVIIHYMLRLSGDGPFDLFHNNPYLQKLNSLAQYDHEHDCNLKEILYWYLLCERRATEAGRELHMHRNTVMYHVQRITETLGLDLDDYPTRQGILMAYHYLELREQE